MNAEQQIFWPERLWLVRHGQSQGNVARDLATEQGLATIGIEIRDVDVPLSDLGHEQAAAAGRWFAALPDEQKPQVILSSPYLRARQTAQAICEAGGRSGGKARTVIDERLREREFGVFDGLTTLGIRQQYPEEAAHRTRLGKFYHRPPGGESWADVILRLRSALNSINLQYSGKRVLIVCHQVVVLCMRYILEELSEQDILSIDKQAEILNCGICAFDFETEELACAPKLALWNHAAPLEQENAPVTSEPDKMVASR
ncbi:histidine phosphatase family protein [Sphingomonas ginkgonis]|uniref:phosphoglycerate mutase (2,3-diphosphoglycerate-dependent) n=1 Tax=Sphingomonas ginkgonis TaxID=2315330 RepID=A0A429VDE1_9SPHN|nr:histidine phosphatase family protein [Sphingomonas ginkgonis]RST32009.1 histidine phosphatase family protein [Sphingomonas ginkgonis]